MIHTSGFNILYRQPNEECYLRAPKNRESVGVLLGQVVVEGLKGWRKNVKEVRVETDVQFFTYGHPSKSITN